MARAELGILDWWTAFGLDKSAPLASEYQWPCYYYYYYDYYYYYYHYPYNYYYFCNPVAQSFCAG